MNIPWIIMGDGRAMVRADRIQGVKTVTKRIPVSEDKDGYAWNVYVIGDNGECYLYTQIVCKEENFPNGHVESLTSNVLEEIRESINTAIEDAKHDPLGNLNKLYRAPAPSVFGQDNNSNKE